MLISWECVWVQQYMELRGDTAGSSANSQHGNRVQRTKNKAVAKQSRHSNTGQFKLHKFGSQSKLDKRTSGRDYDKDEEIQRVFRLHARNQINEDQTLFSLKLLGYVCQTAEDYAKFNKIWNKYDSEFLNEESFRSLAEEVRSKGEIKDNRLIFDILTQGASVLDKSRLLAMGKELGMNTQGLIQFCGREGVIDFAQFDSILKFTNALK